MFLPVQRLLLIPIKLPVFSFCAVWYCWALLVWYSFAVQLLYRILELSFVPLWVLPYQLPGFDLSFVIITTPRTRSISMDVNFC